MKLSGAKAMVFFDSFDNEKMVQGGSGVTTQPDTWYMIFEKGAGSELPLEEGFVFHSPDDEQITLVNGDRIYPIDPRRFCKTSASLQAEQGAIEVGDDCDPGASILDGIVKVSGSIAGFFRYNNESGQFDDVTDDIISRFFDVVEDDGAGLYNLSRRTDTDTYLLCCLNSNAAIGQTENWLFIPIIISSFSMNLGNTDAQNKDLSWTKGEGHPVIYKKKRTA